MTALISAKFSAGAELFGSPAFPVTLTFPFLGLAGFLPLPVKFRLHFGQPLLRVVDHALADRPRLLERQQRRDRIGQL